MKKKNNVITDLKNVKMEKQLSFLQSGELTRQSGVRRVYLTQLPFWTCTFIVFQWTHKKFFLFKTIVCYFSVMHHLINFDLHSGALVRVWDSVSFIDTKTSKQKYSQIMRYLPSSDTKEYSRLTLSATASTWPAINISSSVFNFAAFWGRMVTFGGEHSCTRTVTLASENRTPFRYVSTKEYLESL